MVNKISILLVSLLLVVFCQIHLIATETSFDDGFLGKPNLPPNSLYVRDGDRVIYNSNLSSLKEDVITQSIPPTPPHPFVLLALDNQPIAGGDTLDLQTFWPQSTVNASGHIAFISGVNSASGRNQGVFVSKGTTIQPIVFGCGSGGGGTDHGTCGDQSPIGGTFSGLFHGTEHAPVINDKGDVLFLADLVNAKSNRGIFLYRASRKNIVKVVANGDRSPYGGRLSSVGTAAMNNKNEIAFVAFGYSTEDHQFLLWKEGKLFPIARSLDYASDGSVFTYLSSTSTGWRDGTETPSGTPDINDNGTIVFKSCARLDENTGCGAWIVKNGSIRRLLKNRIHVREPTINNNEDIALTYVSGAEFGWLIRRENRWRKVISNNSRIGEAKVV